MLYNLIKTYESDSVKTKLAELDNLMNVSLEDAISELDTNERLWKKNGGLVIKRTENELVCEEPDGSETITWTIEESDEDKKDTGAENYSPTLYNRGRQKKVDGLNDRLGSYRRRH